MLKRSVEDSLCAYLISDIFQEVSFHTTLDVAFNKKNQPLQMRNNQKARDWKIASNSTKTKNLEDVHGILVTFPIYLQYQSSFLLYHGERDLRVTHATDA